MELRQGGPLVLNEIGMFATLAPMEYATVKTFTGRDIQRTIFSDYCLLYHHCNSVERDFFLKLELRHYLKKDTGYSDMCLKRIVSICW